MYNDCIYQQFSAVLNPGESLSPRPALYDLCPKSTSRLSFHNIDRSPEPVPPPTVFLQVSAPNLIGGSSTFEEFFGLCLSNSLTDSPPVKRRYSSSCSQKPMIPVLLEREQAEAPQAGDPRFWVERSWVPSTGWHIDTKE